jgi:hypothetical protein
MAKEHGEAALRTLAQIAQSGESESARVTAATAILDRAYGKPPQSLEHTGKDGGKLAFTFVLDHAGRPNADEG